MDKKRRKILTVNDLLEPQLGGSENQPILALTFYTSDNLVLEHRCLDENSVAPPSEWKDLTGTIEIEEGVTGIASQAFKGFAAETYIVPNTLSYIGSEAFMSSNVLTIDLTGLDSCTIGTSAFAYCHNLTSIYIPAATSVSSSEFSNCNNLTSVTFASSNMLIGYNAFGSCPSLNLSTLLAYSIDSSAFYNCTSLTNLTIQINGDGVQYIGSSAFANCTGLSTLNISGNTDIFTAAFSKCSKLQTLRLDSGCRNILGEAFKNCSNLSNIYFDVKRYSSYNQYENYLGDARSFLGCTKIKTVYLREGYGVFSPGALITICGGDSIFKYSNESNKEVYHLYAGNDYTLSTIFNIPEGTTTTFNYLSDVDHFTWIAFPTTMTSITSTSWGNCRLNKVVCLATNPPTISEENIFGLEETLLILVPTSSVESYKQAAGWSDYADIIEPLDSNIFKILTHQGTYTGGDTVSIQLNITNLYYFDSIHYATLINSEGDTLSSYEYRVNGKLQHNITDTILPYSNLTYIIGTLTHTLTEDDISNGSYTFRATISGKVGNLNVAQNFEATVNLL